MLRIAFDGRIYGRRGIGRYTASLHRGLSESGQVEITAFGVPRRQDGTDSRWVGLRFPGYVLQEQFELPRLMAGAAFDLVHLTANTAPVLQWRWPPTVVTVHDVMYLLSPKELPLSPSVRQVIGRAYRYLAFQTGTVFADHLICDSSYTADQIRARVGNRAPPMTVVRPALDPAFLAPLRPPSGDTLRQLGLQHRRFFLHPGAVDPRKNTAVVIDAFREYRKAGGANELVIVGLSAVARRAFAVSAHTPGIKLMPFVDDSTLVELIRSAAAVIYVPDVEGFGYPVLEAMASGTPVVMSRIPVLLEIAAGIGWDVEPRAATSLTSQLAELDRVSSSERKRRERVGLDRARDFTVARVAAETLAIYERVIRERATPVVDA